MSKDKSFPDSSLALFWAFTLIALQGYGGVVAIVQREIVDKRNWLSKEEFIDEWAVAQIMPGPNAVNLALMLGSRYLGLRGALAALLGMILFPLIIVLFLGALCTEFSANEAVAGALRGMSAVTAGIIIASGIKLYSGLKKNPMNRWVCAGFALSSFVLIALFHFPLVYVLLSLGSVAYVVAYLAIGKTYG